MGDTEGDLVPAARDGLTQPARHRGDPDRSASVVMRRSCGYLPGGGGGGAAGPCCSSSSDVGAGGADGGGVDGAAWDPAGCCVSLCEG